MNVGLAEQTQLTIIEGRIESPLGMVIDDGDKYALVLADQSRLQAIFAADNGLVPIIEAIQAKVSELDPDVTTALGRAAIRTMAHKVTRSKTYLDGIGKDMVAELKDIPRRIDANRKMMRDQLDAIADDARQPLTDYEAHTKAITDRLNTIDSMPTMYAPSTSAEIVAQYERLSNMPLTVEAWDGFLEEATTITRRTLPILREMFEAKRKAELDAVELDRLRGESVARERKDEEAKRMTEARERGSREAELRGEQERQAALGREAEAVRQAELVKQRFAEVERLSKERDEAHRRDMEQAEARRLDEKRAAEDRAERARLDGIAAEHQRQADAAAQEASVKAAREADKVHSKQINGEVLADIAACIPGIELAASESRDAIARAVTISIIKGLVRHLTLTY